MKCSVNVPLDRELEFPNRCPFSDTPSPTGTVRLKRTSSSFVTPMPGGFRNAYTTTLLQFPAQRTIAILAVFCEIMIWLSILTAMLLAVLLVNKDGPDARYASLFVVSGPALALGFRLARWIVLRRVRIGNAWNGFIEVHFDSATYAKEFSELNRLALAA